MGKILGCYLMPHPPIIIPKIGGGNQFIAFDTLNACKKISNEISSLVPNTIVILSPHGFTPENQISIIDTFFANGDFAEYGAPDLSMEAEIDYKLTKSIINAANENNFPISSLNHQNTEIYGKDLKLDHGAMVPLYFLNNSNKKYKIVHITCTDLPKLELYKFGILLENCIKNSSSNVVIVASGDLSHKLKDNAYYDYNEIGEVFDKQILNILKNSDVVSLFNMNNDIAQAAAQCALNPLYIMFGCCNYIDLKSNFLSYEGPFGIGYAVFSFHKIGDKIDGYLSKLEKLHNDCICKTITNESIYSKLARNAIKHYILTGNYLENHSDYENHLLNDEYGVFISLKNDGILRGCVGTLEPKYKNLKEEIIHNSVESALYDPRFNPVDISELDMINISIDIICALEHCSIDDLAPSKYGVLARYGNKEGILLPNIPGIDSSSEQIKLALCKAGIKDNEEYSLFRFETKKFN